MTTPAVYPLQVYRGDEQAWRFACFDDTAQTVASSFTTGVTAQAEIRDRPGGWLMCRLVCAVELPNIVHARLRRRDSQLLPMQGAWDLKLVGYPSGTTQTILTGIVAVAPNITESLWR